MSWFKCMALIMACVLTGCASPSAKTVRHTLPSGQFLDFQLFQDMPEPVENDLVRIVHASLRIDSTRQEEDGLKALWHFAFRAKSYNLARVRVYDISGETPVLLVDDGTVFLNEDDVWQMETPSRPLNRANMPWFFLAAKEERIFQFVITTGDGDTSELFQMVYFPPELKKAVWEFIRFDDVWTATYQCIVKKNTAITQKRLDRYYGLIAELAARINEGSAPREALLKSIGHLEDRLQRDYLYDYLYEETQLLRRQVVGAELEAPLNPRERL